jgi:hypothetical protein
VEPVNSTAAQTSGNSNQPFDALTHFGEAARPIWSEELRIATPPVLWALCGGGFGLIGLWRGAPRKAGGFHEVIELNRYRPAPSSKIARPSR